MLRFEKVLKTELFQLRFFTQNRVPKLRFKSNFKTGDNIQEIPDLSEETGMNSDQAMTLIRH